MRGVSLSSRPQSLTPVPPPEGVEWLTIPNIAYLLQCSVATVKRRMYAGEIPSHRDGRLRRVKRSEFEEWLRGVAA